MITGRPAALLALGAFAVAGVALIGTPVGYWPWLAATVVVLMVAVLCLADLALAAPLGGVRLGREGERSCWLGESTAVP